MHRPDYRMKVLHTLALSPERDHHKHAARIHVEHSGVTLNSGSFPFFFPNFFCPNRADVFLPFLCACCWFFPLLSTPQTSSEKRKLVTGGMTKIQNRKMTENHHRGDRGYNERKLAPGSTFQVWGGKGENLQVPHPLVVNPAIFLFSPQHLWHRQRPPQFVCAFQVPVRTSFAVN